MQIKKYLQYLWPIFGIIIMILSAKLLYNEFHNPHNQLSHLKWDDIFIRLKALSCARWLLAILSAIVAYSSLAGYDRIALEHLGKKISWWFIGICSFSAYALSHSIGASIFSGAAIRYRAYSTKGLTGAEVAVLVAFCSFTFALGVIILLGFLLLYKPEIACAIKPHLINILHHDISEQIIKYSAIGFAISLILFVILYIYGSWRQLPPLNITNNFKIFYPKLNIVLKQLIIGPLEILGSSGIIYFMLPTHCHASFAIVTAAFLISFTLGILSNAPGGGLGIFELIFLSLVPNIDPRDLLVAIIAFRFMYIIIPLIISIIFVIIFEIKQYGNKNIIRR